MVAGVAIVKIGLPCSKQIIPTIWRPLHRIFLLRSANRGQIYGSSIWIDFKTSAHQVLLHMQKFHAAQLKRSSSAGGRNLNDDFEQAATGLRDITDEEQENVNKLLARWVAMHFRPIIITEDDDFLQFVRYITEDLGHVNVPIPKRFQLRRAIVTFASELREFVKREIAKSCEYFSMTADIWTARNGRSYIAFTIHYVDEDFKPKNWTLEVNEIPGKYTGELIAAFLDNIMDEWDSARRPILEVKHVFCLAHDIHLVLSGAMSNDKSTATLGQSPPWTSAVAEEPDYIENDYEEDESLSEQERSEMERLREAEINFMDGYLEKTLTNLEKGDMVIAREVVQKFR
ncbi:hypothetical protein GN244_ATG14067 [Phytophthora infestans]|uniref:Uncharacterized protein n=1 Tax=Phytophthora infestans TaxID=4787 RepID=A0A833S613_PHYIN|nr:hypothetical protein GN244_ATG14067 [Phytophthora infestans]